MGDRCSNLVIADPGLSNIFPWTIALTLNAIVVIGIVEFHELSAMKFTVHQSTTGCAKHHCTKVVDAQMITSKEISLEIHVIYMAVERCHYNQALVTKIMIQGENQIESFPLNQAGTTDIEKIISMVSLFIMPGQEKLLKEDVVQVPLQFRINLDHFCQTPKNRLPLNLPAVE